MKKSETEEDKWSLDDRKRIPPRAWESAVEKRIREAIDRGEFDNLAGQGKPLDLRRDPNTPAEWELAFKLLKDAGMAPDWIEQDKEITNLREKLFKPFERYLYSFDPGEAISKSRSQTGRPHRSAEREKSLIIEFREQAANLNRIIDVYNLKAPSPRVHHRRIRIEDEIARFVEACTRLDG